MMECQDRHACVVQGAPRRNDVIGGRDEFRALASLELDSRHVVEGEYVELVEETSNAGRGEQFTGRWPFDQVHIGIERVDQA